MMKMVRLEIKNKGCLAISNNGWSDKDIDEVVSKILKRCPVYNNMKQEMRQTMKQRKPYYDSGLFGRELCQLRYWVVPSNKKKNKEYGFVLIGTNRCGMLHECYSRLEKGLELEESEYFEGGYLEDEITDYIQGYKKRLPPRSIAVKA